MGFQHLTDDKKRQLIEKVESLANEKGISPHRAAATFGAGARSRYYAYKKSLGLTTVESKTEVVNIHPEKAKPNVRRERITRAVLVYGSLKELAQFAKEVESA